MYYGIMMRALRLGDVRMVNLNRLLDSDMYSVSVLLPLRLANAGEAASA
jgi:hypothetical protein